MLRLPQPLLWMVPVVLATWGIVQVVEARQSPAALDVPSPPPAVVASSAAPSPILSPSPVAVRALPRSTPARIVIKSVWINAAIDQIGLARDGTLETPSYERAKNAAWYKHGPSPGETGPAVIVGHVDSKTERAVFFELRRVKPGAIIEITRADRKKVLFKVDSVEQFPKSQFPTERVYGHTPEPTLRVITCGGKFDEKRKEYPDNIVVFASLAQ